MKDIQLRPYQNKAITAIQEAFARRQKNIVVEMASGCGKGLVFAKTIENLQKEKIDKILVVVGNLSLKDRLIREISTNYNGFVKLDKSNLLIETEQRLLHNSDEALDNYNIVIFYEALFRNAGEILTGKEKTVIVFSAFGNEIMYENKISTKPYSPKDIVFSYTFQEALNDGYMTPAMDARARGPALEVFSQTLLARFGYIQIDNLSREHEYIWDSVLQKQNQKIWVECKAYKSQTVSPSIANDLLKTLVMRKMKQNISQEDIILLIVSSYIPSFQKGEIFERYRIVVWDIDNLVFYSKNDPALLKQLSQITYYPIDHIQGQPSSEAETAKLLSPYIAADKQLEYAEKEANKNETLIKEIEDCPAGRENSREYEEICEKILRHLFEANYFNRLTSQHKTNDEHFRMDLIGSLKINQNNDESMHPLWQMLVQHYNSHFVVFEFKNYTNKIDQNLIYITEKYLFDAALRNVAFIISREGFSDAAKFAAEGCLKEHGKLILDVTNEDLIKMLKSPSDNPADHLLTKLEEFLMGISK